MRNVFLLLFTLTSLILVGQEFPMTFDAPEDDSWNGFGGTEAFVSADPDDAGNQVLQIVGATGEFDGASINMGRFVDLSDDANNTITFDMYVPLDGSSSNMHLLKFEGGSSGAIDMAFSTSGTGWQQVSVDFGPGLGTEYPIMVIFTDAGTGNFGTGTYYVDNIDGPNGDVVGMAPVPSGPAPAPTEPDAEVLSIYEDAGYTNVWMSDYDFGTAPAEIDLGVGMVNNAWRFNFQAGGYGQGTNEPIDISQYDAIQFDYWADANSPELRFFMIDNVDGVVTEYFYQIGSTTGSDEPITNEAWTSVSIPMSFFENIGFSPENFLQWKVDVSSNLVSQFVYIDNIIISGGDNMSADTRLSTLEVENTPVANFDPNVFAYTLEIDPAVPMPQVTLATAIDTMATVVINQATAYPGQASVVVSAMDGSSSTYTVDFIENTVVNVPAAPTPTIPEERVISLFSDAYTNVPVDTWNTPWSNATWTDTTLEGNQTYLYTNLVFNGVETVMNPINAEEAGMEFVHIDLWSNNIDSVEFKLVDFLGDGFGDTDMDGMADSESFVYLPLQEGQWNSFEIPLQDFLDAGITALSDLNQYIITGFPNGGDLYVDNVYFSRLESSVEGPVFANTIKVSPNPMDRGQEIIIPGEIVLSTITDMRGREIHRTQSNMISTTSWNAGMYLLTMEDRTGDLHVQKLIIK